MVVCISDLGLLVRLVWGLSVRGFFGLVVARWIVRVRKVRKEKEEGEESK